MITAVIIVSVETSASILASVPEATSAPDFDRSPNSLSSLPNISLPTTKTPSKTSCNTEKSTGSGSAILPTEVWKNSTPVIRTIAATIRPEIYSIRP